MREQTDKLAWHKEGSEKIYKTVIMLGKKRFGYAYASPENPQETRETLDEMCLRYNTWPQIWLALKATERGDKHWMTEVKAAIKAAGEGDRLPMRLSAIKDKRTPADLHDVPFPACAKECSCVGHLGVGECDSICPEKSVKEDRS